MAPLGIAVLRQSDMHFCMNWQAISFDWGQVRTFLATVETGSFTAAAKALRMTQPTVGRHIAALEADLKVTLFERNGRGVALTSAGQDLLPHVQAMADAAGGLSLTASGKGAELSGTVSITSTDLVAATLLIPIVRKLRLTHPRIAIRMVSSDEVQNLIRRDADIAVRHVEPTQAELIARRLPDLSVGFYAAPGYLDRVGRPQNRGDLQEHDLIGYSDISGLVRMLQGVGIEVSEDQFVVSSTSAAVLWELVQQGLGMTVLPCALGEPSPRLERVLPEEQLVQFPTWITTHRELHTSPRIRAVFDALVAGLGQIA